MAHTFLKIQAQIHKLQAEAEKLRIGERTQVIEKIKVAVAAFDLTPADLFGNGQLSTKNRQLSRPPVGSASNGVAVGKAKPVAAPRKVQNERRVAIKYRDGTNVWSGRGSHPKWLLAAIASGNNIEQFRV